MGVPGSRTAPAPTRASATSRRPARGPRARWPTVAGVLIVVVAMLVGLGLRQSGATARSTRSLRVGTARGVGASASAASPSITPTEAPPSPSPVSVSPVSPSPSPLLVAGPVSVQVPGFFSWALLDRRTGAVAGSANDESSTSSTESMIKVWIAADYLRGLGGQQPSQRRLDELRRMIRDSDDQVAEDIYRADDGDAVVRRMINTCGLVDTTITSGWWSMTQISARDAVRLGQCVADGRAAGPTWTAWVLEQMRQVEGEGRFGIIDALPADVVAETAIKNGWTLIYADGLWHVSCLAVHDDFVLAVLARYPGSLGLSYGANVCKSVAAQLQNHGSS